MVRFPKCATVEVRNRGPVLRIYTSMGFKIIRERH